MKKAIPAISAMRNRRWDRGWNLPNPPAEVRLLRATILQWQHQFDAARLDLDAVISADDKGVVQAHLTRATVLMVQGEPDAARHDCAALVNHTEPLIAATCIAAASALMGRAVPMEAALTTALTQTGKATPAASVWAYTELAEINDRLGRVEAARRDYQQALQLQQATGHRDPYLLASYADFLLDRGENAQVVLLLDGLERIDNLLLRLALAETALGRTDAAMRSAAAVTVSNCRSASMKHAHAVISCISVKKPFTC